MNACAHSGAGPAAPPENDNSLERAAYLIDLAVGRLPAPPKWDRRRSSRRRRQFNLARGRDTQAARSVSDAPSGSMSALGRPAGRDV
jgi:hypothetical protein